jgi:hypothetical protein
LEDYKKYRFYKRELLESKKKKLGENNKESCCHTNCCGKSSKMSTVNPGAPKVLQKSDEIEVADIDNIDIKLNDYMKDDVKARKNWFKLKFRMQMIASFVKLSKWIKDEIDEEEIVDEDEPSEYKQPWYIIRHETIGKNIWDMFTNIVYVSSFFIVLFSLAFQNEYLDDN